MQENTPEIIKVIGEEGEEVMMKLQEVITVDDKDYALLSVVKEDALPTQDEEEDELILMRMNQFDNECTFEIIEDDEEFNNVTQAINEADDLEETEEQ